MTVDCQWIHKNLETLFCGTLSPEENRIARAHIESCGSCDKEVAALNAIDPLVKGYFQTELNRALRVSAARSRPLWRRRPALTSTFVLAASILLAVALRTPHQNPVIYSTSVNIPGARSYSVSGTGIGATSED